MIIAAIGAAELIVGATVKRRYDRRKEEAARAARAKRDEERRASTKRRTTRARRTPSDAPMTETQWTAARRLAMFRDISPGVLTTRAERHAAIERVLTGATSARANQVIAKLRTCPPAPYRRWQERTPWFAVLHAKQVARIRGEVEPSDHCTLEGYRRRHGWTIPAKDAPVERTALALVAGPLTAADTALADAILGKRPARPTVQELRDYVAALDTREDPVWGTVVVGGSL